MLPDGKYRGHVLAVSNHLLLRLARRYWRGKIIRGSSVTNRIGWFRGLRGTQKSKGGVTTIEYPFFGVYDRLNETAPGVWSGWMASTRFPKLTAVFTLTRE